eukprot:3629585-Amphidinium_carterae.1
MTCLACLPFEGSLHAVEQSSQNFAHTKSDVEESGEERLSLTEGCTRTCRATACQAEADASPVAGRTGYLSEPEESEESDASVEHFAAPSEEKRSDQQRNMT